MDRRSGGRPTLEQSAAMASIILDAARVAFRRDGFTDASMDQIAERIGASKLTIYRRFESKEELLCAVVDEDLEQLRTLMDGAADEGDAVEALRQVAQRLFRHIMSPDIIAAAALIKGEAARRPSIRQRFALWDQIIEEPMADLVRRAQLCGRLRRDVDETLLAGLLRDLLRSLAERQRLATEAYSEGALEALFAMRWEVFLRYAAVDPVVATG